MELARHRTSVGARWALDGQLLDADFSLAALLGNPQSDIARTLDAARTGEPIHGPRLAPIEALQEVWAAGVTYLRSREAREVESETADVYERVYSAARPELFFKSTGFRAVGPEEPIRVRADSRWNAPEPELTLVINRAGEIVGYCVGNDVSSRDIEGENPLYLPQAKVFDGSCAVGPAIVLADAGDMADLPIALEIRRDAKRVFAGETRSSQMARPLSELAQYLTRELSFPHGVLLMTGTGIVPPDEFSLRPGDVVSIEVGALQLQNEVSA